MPSVSTDRFPEPEMAKAFLEKKIEQPTKRWDDLKWGEHAHAFTVAHSNEAAVLDMIHGLLNRAIKEGLPFQDFKNNMLDMMKASGWYGGSGHTGDDKQYINWRIKTIYETNMRTAYAQARYRKQLQGASLRPIWVYQSQLAGKNRRQEHVALHSRAYRYDDPFWDTYYPPNGWGCQCYVTTKSEAGAERDGITVGDSSQDDLPEIDKTWAYNVGREAFAPNFARYKNLPEKTMRQIMTNYRKSMNDTKMTGGEFRTILKRASEADYKPLHIQYMVGNMDNESFEAMSDIGVVDSKVMCSDTQLYHGAAKKNERQKVPERLFGDLYELLNSPEMIYEESVSGKTYRVFHFVKDTGDGKKIKIILHMKKLNHAATALEVRTIGYSSYEYNEKKYRKIW